MWPSVGLDVAELDAELFVVLDTGLLVLITRMFSFFLFSYGNIELSL